MSCLTAIVEGSLGAVLNNEFSLLRINTIYDAPSNYADDSYIGTEQRIVINFWCQTAAQSEAIVKRIDAILTEAGFEWYTANETPRYKDNDIGLLMNVRKYRFFDWGN